MQVLTPKPWTAYADSGRTEMVTRGLLCCARVCRIPDLRTGRTAGWRSGLAHLLGPIFCWSGPRIVVLRRPRAPFAGSIRRARLPLCYRCPESVLSSESSENVEVLSEVIPPCHLQCRRSAESHNPGRVTSQRTQLDTPHTTDPYLQRRCPRSRQACSMWRPFCQ